MTGHSTVARGIKCSLRQHAISRVLGRLLFLIWLSALESIKKRPQTQASAACVGDPLAPDFALVQTYCGGLLESEAVVGAFFFSLLFCPSNKINIRKICVRRGNNIKIHIGIGNYFHNS